MNCVVVNAGERLSRLRGKVSFEHVEYYNYARYRNEMLKLLQKQAESFVLLWHEDPEIGLKVLYDIRQNGALPARWRGCVFFRAVAYAGLLTEERAASILKETDFADNIHMVPSLVSETNPSDELLSRFERFVDAVRAIEPDDVPLPFDIFKPPGNGAGISLLLLAEHLINDKRLSVEEVIAAMDWPLIIKDGKEAGYSLGLVPDDEAPAPYQILNYAHQYQSLLREQVKWRCDLCDQRHHVFHNMLLRKILDPARRMKGLYRLNIEPEEMRALLTSAEKTIDSINSQLSLLSDERSPYQAVAVSHISQYLKANSLNVAGQLSSLIQELFKARCHLYINREGIEREVNKLKEIAAELASRPATDIQHLEVSLGDLIKTAEKIQSLLQCPCMPTENEVQLYEITKNINHR
jgi:flagellar biosynthesis chaperone FliJ